MTITVIGHVCIDQYQGPKGTHEQWGGILYSLLTLANLMGEGDTVRPVCSVGASDFDTLMQLLGRYPTIDTSGIYTTDEPTNRVMLLYHQNGEHRTECSHRIAAPIPWTRIKPFVQADGILINMVSGFDITLETLDHLRMEARKKGTPLHLDLHSLTLGVDSTAERFRRPVPEWRRWCFGMNSVQVSEEEAAGLTTEGYDEAALINQLLSLMVNAFIITRGARGLTLITHAKKTLTRHDIAGTTAGTAVDPTGCGDVFGAAWLYSWLKTQDARAAAHFANCAAAWKASVRGVEALDALRHHLLSTDVPV
jgi:sugar/nucleoside kinase (ribokinase family)